MSTTAMTTVSQTNTTSQTVEVCSGDVHCMENSCEIGGNCVDEYGNPIYNELGNRARCQVNFDCLKYSLCAGGSCRAPAAGPTTSQGRH